MAKSFLGSRLPPLVALISVLLSVSVARADDDDVVLLKNGGRVRGSVISQDPREGVKVKLANGTFRTIPAADVDRVQFATDAQPAAPAGAPPAAAPPAAAPPAAAPPAVPAGSGAIHVHAGAPGRVFVDGGLVGPAPADVAAAAPGLHVVRVEFDGGGTREERILVQPGQAANVDVALPTSAAAFSARSGTHFGVGVDFGFLLFPHLEDGFGHSFEGFVGGTAKFVVNTAAASAVDLRTTAFVGIEQGPFTIVPIGASFGARFNLGSVYTMAVGFRGAGLIVAGSNGPSAFAAFGPELSVVGFRFGSKREISLELVDRVNFYTFPGDLTVSTDHVIDVQYLFL